MPRCADPRTLVCRSCESRIRRSAGSRNLRRPMARWRGIFGRKGKREGEPDATRPLLRIPETTLSTALYPRASARGAGRSRSRAPHDTGDREQVTGTAEWPPASRPLEPDTGPPMGPDVTGRLAPPTSQIEEERARREMARSRSRRPKSSRSPKRRPEPRARAGAAPRRKPRSRHRRTDPGRRRRGRAGRRRCAPMTRSLPSRRTSSRSRATRRPSSRRWQFACATPKRDHNRPTSAPIGWPPSATRSRRRPAKPRPSGCAGR